MTSFTCPSGACVSLEVVDPKELDKHRGDNFVMTSFSRDSPCFLGRYSAYDFLDKGPSTWQKIFTFKRPQSEVTPTYSRQSKNVNDAPRSYTQDDFDVFTESITEGYRDFGGSLGYGTKLYLVKYHGGSVQPQDYQFIETKAAQFGKKSYHESW